MALWGGWIPTAGKPPDAVSVPGWYVMLELFTAGGIPSAETFGTAKVGNAAEVLQPTGIPSAQVFGTALLTTGATTIAPRGVPSVEAFGIPKLSPAQYVAATGIPSAQAFGATVLSTGPVAVAPTGITSAETFGTSTVVPPTRPPFTPFTEENIPRSSQPLPTDAAFKGVWVTLIGAGGGGSGGETGAGSKSYAGGSGGGGGARVPRTFISKTVLGAVYNVNVPSAGGAGAVATSTPGTSGADTSFVSGSTNIVAGGGKAGTTYLAAGLGGTVSGAAGVSGTNGGAGVSAGAGGPGIDGPTTNSGGAGGGGGGASHVLGTRYASGKGGDANGQPGGAAVGATSLPGNPGSVPVAGLSGSGASGGGADNAAGGAGRGYGSGAGGASLWNPNGGQGGPGYSRIEFTDVAPVKPVYASTGAGMTHTGTIQNPSWVHNIPVGANALVVFTQYEGNGANHSAVTCGGVAMTQLVRNMYYAGGGAYFNHFAYVLLNPPTGNQTIAMTGNIASHGQSGNSLAYSGVGSFGAPVIGSGTVNPLSLAVPSTSYQMVTQSFAQNNGALSTYDKTQRWKKDYVGGTNYPIVVGDADGASALTFGATYSTSTVWGGIGIPLLPA